MSRSNFDHFAPARPEVLAAVVQDLKDNDSNIAAIITYQQAARAAKAQAASAGDFKLAQPKENIGRLFPERLNESKTPSTATFSKKIEKLLKNFDRFYPWQRLLPPLQNTTLMFLDILDVVDFSRVSRNFRQVGKKHLLKLLNPNAYREANGKNETDWADIFNERMGDKGVLKWIAQAARDYLQGILNFDLLFGSIHDFRYIDTFFFHQAKLNYLFLKQFEALCRKAEKNLNEQVETNTLDPTFINDKNLFFWAICFNQLNLIRYLIQEKMDIVSSIPSDSTASKLTCSSWLHVAASLGRCEVVEILLHHKANPKDPEILMSAVKRGDLRTTKHLLDFKAEVDQSVSNSNQTALGVASGRGHYSIVQLLIQRNANVNRRNLRAINSAILDENLPVVDLLLEAKAEVNRPGLSREPGQYLDLCSDLCISNPYVKKRILIVELDNFLKEDCLDDNDIAAAGLIKAALRELDCKKMQKILIDALNNRNKEYLSQWCKKANQVIVDIKKRFNIKRTKFVLPHSYSVNSE